MKLTSCPNHSYPERYQHPYHHAQLLFFWYHQPHPAWLRFAEDGQDQLFEYVVA
jgi:hypothetical protein